jgi:hypothetical protein
MKTGYWSGCFVTMVFSIATFRGFAQPATNSILRANSSNQYFREFVFLPGGLRSMAATISATNENFRQAIKYIGEVRAGRPPPQLPNGVTEADISNANYQIFIWPMITPQRSINFYGNVVDENGRPVADATAHFEWDGTITNKNTMAMVDSPRISTNLITDGGGLFSLTNQSGTELAHISQINFTNGS